MFTSVAFVAIICFSFVRVSTELSCKNGRNSNVDWFINYKLPKIEGAAPGSALVRGEAYTYLLPSSTDSKWRLSAKSINSSSSMIGNTLKKFYSNKMNLTYLIYNDEAPDNISRTSVGHTKGIVAFDRNSGFWLIHSIPKFPSENSFGYPSNGLENGQSILCISFDATALNEIGKQLLFNHPNIYAKRLDDGIKDQLDVDVKSLFSEKPAFIKKSPFSRITTLRSVNNVAFKSFAKDNQYNDDLYSALIGPELGTSLLTETWRRGAGTLSPPACQMTYTVLNIVSINMTALSNRGSTNVPFNSTEDHSKWAISEGPDSTWVCIGDINRMESQKRRGGGSVCLSSSRAWRAYKSVVANTDNCNQTRAISH